MTHQMALSTQVGASSTGSSSPWKYDVFLSFRGADTRAGITDHLHKELLRQGIRTFRDDPELERGTYISLELLSAIEQSRSAIVVLSPNYATSTWCLLELCKIFDCMEERGAILPIFYKVNACDVRRQTGSFAEAFDKHIKDGEDSMKMQGWRDALRKVANLAGWSSNNYGYETKLFEDVLLALRSKVYPTLTITDSSEKLVGMETKLEEMDVLLDRKANDVRLIGIWGMGGIGKTTLARLVYEKISYQFDVCIFVPNVREVSAKHGPVYQQKQIISQILKEENAPVWDLPSGITMTKRCLHNKAVLLVFDDVDVDQVEQMEMLVGEQDWFCLKSRIIITTRDRHVLVTLGIEKLYELKGLNDDEALQLFSLKAFRKYEPEEDFAELSTCFVSYASGLPLALKIIGASLYKRSPDAWISALEKLRNTPNMKLFDVLKVSYHGLDRMEKKYFLDIACFSSQCEAKFIIELLYSSDICARITIDVLVERCLLTVSDDNEIGIHDLIQEMGCDIVREKSYDEPGERSRLWLPKDIIHVFTRNTGTDAVEAIFLHFPSLEVANWNCEAFSKMCKLKLLYIHNLRLSAGPEYLSDALTFLNWSWYPSKSLPRSFQPDELIELSLVHSNVDHLWDDETKHLAKLKSIDLSYSIKLRKTPDFTGIQNLEKLVLEGCTNLVEIHPSIAFLKRLKILNFRNCKSIQSLPSEVEMKSLETFDVSGCSKLQVIPEFLGQMNRLSKLSLSGTAVERLPPSYEHLSESLVELDLCGIVIRELPFSPILKKYLRLLSFGLFPRMSLHPLSPLLSSMKHLTYLTTLKLKYCNLSEGEIPVDIGCLSSLEVLDLRGNNFVTLPASIHLLSKLKEFIVENCKRLQQLPSLPSTEELEVRMDNCTSLQVFPDLPAALGSLTEFQLSCINCLKMFGDQDCSYFIYSVLKRLLEGTPCSFDYFNFTIPGGEIVEWFNNQSVGDSVTLQLPSYARNSNKWIGVAVCALFVPEDNPSAVPEDDFLQSGKNKIICSWDGSKVLIGFGSVLTQIVSDHLFIVVLPSLLWRPRNSFDDTCSEVKFAFETTQAVGNKRCIKVKQCAVRALYEHDMEELISKVNQLNEGISLYVEDALNWDLERSEYEQGGAIVQGTPEAAPSTSGDSEDEYFSAEE